MTYRIEQAPALHEPVDVTSLAKPCCKVALRTVVETVWQGKGAGRAKSGGFGRLLLSFMSDPETGTGTRILVALLASPGEDLVLRAQDALCALDNLLEAAKASGSQYQVLFGSR